MKALEMDPTKVREALDRITGSEKFARSSRASQFLRYVVGKTLEGAGEQIKEYTIAAEVFGRESYDPKVDALVRVEAARLRKLLAEYYEGEGARERIRIRIERGAYVPLISEHSGEGRLWRWAAAAGVLAAGLLAALQFAGNGRVASVAAPPAIAVLPFEDLNSSGGRSAMSEAISESAASELGRLVGLQVTPLLSAARYRQATLDVGRIGRELKVHALLQGAVRRGGDKLKVSVHLTDTRNGFQAWTTSYEITAGEDALAVEREVGKLVSKEFRTDLNSLRRALTRQQTSDERAYHFYQQASRLIEGDSEESRRAVDLFRAAAEADPRYALALAGEASGWLQLASYGDIPHREACAKAAAAAQRAAGLDEGLAEAHEALARIALLERRDWREAEARFLRALALDPAWTAARRNFATMVLAPLGRFEEALDQLRQALALAPQDNTMLSALASVCVKAGRHAEAEQYVNQSLAMADRSPAAHMARGMNLASQGRHLEAVASFERAMQIRRSAWTQAHLAYSLSKAGRSTEAGRQIAELRSALSGTNPPLFECAVAVLAAGQRKEAIALLERAAEARSESVLWVKVDYRLAELRSEPDFQKLLRRLNL